MRGGEEFWEQMIRCSEAALNGEYAAIKPGKDSVGDDFRINFIPLDDEPGIAVAVIPTADTYGLERWFARADALS